MRGSSLREEENISQKLAGDLLMALNEDLENEEIYCLATTLDPRYKTRIFQLHSTTSTTKKRLVELIINLNEDLYSENASDMVAPTPSTSSEMTASGGLWSVCENIIRESEEDDPLSTLSSSNSLKEEVEKYLRSPNIPRDADPLLFWHNDVLYPHLKKLAQKYFSFQMSSVASERLFSTAGISLVPLNARSQDHDQGIVLEPSRARSEWCVALPISTSVSRTSWPHGFRFSRVLSGTGSPKDRGLRAQVQGTKPNKLIYITVILLIPFLEYLPGYWSPLISNSRARGNPVSQRRAVNGVWFVSTARALRRVARRPGSPGTSTSWPRDFRFSEFSRKRATKKIPNSARLFSLKGRFEQRLKSRGLSIVFLSYSPGRVRRLPKFRFFEPRPKTGSRSDERDTALNSSSAPASADV
ncbi:Zinc finger BED domain-containing protein 4 [Eumeta japonica]|uniref:Zinc finger BED domain-containing protein 4 n=1 Tax=Eumeta variegata TaxID=151549 RepID=A0A4C1TEC8_EUMVA|nr:Zinc finger BED domain-containing protein 4 [Eumeta japonica]